MTVSDSSKLIRKLLWIAPDCAQFPSPGRHKAIFGLFPSEDFWSSKYC